MTTQRILTLVVAIALGAGAWRAGGWAGVALLASGLVLWFMLATTAILGPFLYRHIAIGRVAGAALLSIYAAYTVWLLA